MRHNNIRIHSIPEGTEKNNTIDFITGFIKSKIQNTGDMEIRIERAHWSLVAKPRDGAPPRELSLCAFWTTKLRNM